MLAVSWIGTPKVIKEKVMSYDSTKPSNDGYVSQGPTEIRENMRALKDDQIVDAGELKGLAPSDIKHRVDVFKTAGSSTWTCPSGVTKVFITAIGAGGGGGGSGDNKNYAGTGGGAGHIKIKEPITVVPETEYTVVVGAGGSAGSDGGAGSDGADGSVGASTSFKDGSTLLLEASGGKKGAGASATANAASRMVDVLTQGSPSPIGANDYGIFTDASLDSVVGCYGGGGMGGASNVTVTYRSGASITLGGAQPGHDGLLIIEY